jgi:predicted phage terminase large subunit-like protein
MSVAREDTINRRLAEIAAREVEIERAGVEALKERVAVARMKPFVQMFWKIVEPRRPLIWGRHMDIICRAVEQSYRGELPGALIANIPPRHSKSTLVGVMGPAWWWLTCPEHQFLCITKADKNAKRDARHMRRIVSSPEYQKLVARQAIESGVDKWTWSEDQNEIHYFANTAGGHRISMTTDTDVTGAGCDTLICDDVHDAEEVANSGPERAKRLMDEVWVKHDEVWSPRLNPGGRIQGIHQRLHEADWSGRMIARAGTTFVVLPLEFEAAHPYRHPDDHRQEGEVLAANRFSETDLARLKATPQMYAGQAQQRPSPKGGGQIKREWFKQYACQPRDFIGKLDELWVSSDAAKKDKANSDYHAIHVWGRIGARKILLDRRHERMTYPTYERAMDGIIELWKPNGTLVEDTANGTTYIQCRQSTIHNLIAFHPNSIPGNDKSKSARAIYIERAAEAGQIELPDPRICPWVEEFIYELTVFPSGIHDDDVDAASQILIRWILATPSPSPVNLRAASRAIARMGDM